MTGKSVHFWQSSGNGNGKQKLSAFVENCYHFGSMAGFENSSPFHRGSKANLMQSAGGLGRDPQTGSQHNGEVWPGGFSPLLAGLPSFSGQRGELSR